jgi:hypothetical protein
MSDQKQTELAADFVKINASQPPKHKGKKNKDYLIKDLPDEAKAQIVLGQNEVKNKLEFTQQTVALMKAKLKSEGVPNKKINQVINDSAIEQSKAIKNLPQGLKPGSGMTRENAIVITHTLQELLLLKHINALPLRPFMTQHEGKIYDEYLVMRESVIVKDEATRERMFPDAKPTYKMTSVWFDITAVHEEITKTTGRSTTNRPFTGLMSCGGCGKSNSGNLMMHCKRCKSYVYCSKECQRKHYKTGGHKADCKKICEEALEGAAKVAKQEEENDKRDVPEDAVAQQNQTDSKAGGEGWRVLTVYPSSRMNDFVNEYKRMMLNDYPNDLFEFAVQPAEDAPFAFSLAYESKMENAAAIAILKEHKAFSVSVSGLGTRKAAKKNEPKTGDVLFAVISDYTHAIYDCMVRTGGKETKTFVPVAGVVNVPITLNAEFAYLKKGEGVTYVEMARAAREILETYEKICTSESKEAADEYVSNTLKLNEELSKRALKAEVVDTKDFKVLHPFTLNFLHVAAMNVASWTLPITQILTNRAIDMKGTLVKLKRNNSAADAEVDERLKLTDDEMKETLVIDNTNETGTGDDDDDYRVRVVDVDGVQAKVKLPTSESKEELKVTVADESSAAHQTTAKALSPGQHTSFSASIPDG